MGRRCQPSCRAKRPLPRFPTVWPKRSPGNLAQAWGATGTGQHRRRLPLATYEAGGESLTGRQTTTARSGAPTPATARGPQSFHRQSDRRAVDHSGLWVRAGPHSAWPLPPPQSLVRGPRSTSSCRPCWPRWYAGSTVALAGSRRPLRIVIRAVRLKSLGD